MVTPITWEAGRLMSICRSVAPKPSKIGCRKKLLPTSLTAVSVSMLTVTRGPWHQTPLLRAGPRTVAWKLSYREITRRRSDRNQGAAWRAGHRPSRRDSRGRAILQPKQELG